jgi:hypothetical protein
MDMPSSAQKYLKPGRNEDETRHRAIGDGVVGGLQKGASHTPHSTTMQKELQCGYFEYRVERHSEL